ncbi:MAG: 2-(1,2-epoxy-1,2-dihydrophenyl)acetyl-CoA isomerase [Halieaceae bacterium]|nr:2-(1,2-epoxy-1,2-dihydrophenyl)acetyl-CoA isomerase [Halieaceae bacterium]
MLYEHIEYTVARGVACLTLNRPDSLNSFTAAMHGEVAEVLKAAAEDRAIRAVVITGAGRGFCAGQDLNDRNVAPGERVDLGESVDQFYNPLIRRITGMEKPVICAVNGVAAGAGANLALACDLVFAAESAKFVESFAMLGLIPDSGGSWHLPRMIGMARAKGMAMLMPKVTAQQAKEWGLIWEVVEDAKLMDTVMALAEHLATQPTRGFAYTKQAFSASMTNTLDEQLELEKTLMSTAGFTDDYAEGVKAFLKKRQPEYKGQ